MPSKLAAALLLMGVLPYGAALAEEAKPAAAAPQATAAPADVKPSDSPPDASLTPEEKAEKEARKACKVDMCSAFRTKRADGGDIACTVQKSWRKEQLTKLVTKMKVSWPYGPVRCTAAVNIKRADIVKAVSEPKFEMTLDKHSVVCVIDKEDKAASEIKFDFTPKVTFENGKATKAKMNWGKLEAPALIKSALWTATAADNTVNMLSGTLIEDINDFITKKCDEVKEDWEKK